MSTKSEKRAQERRLERIRREREAKKQANEARVERKVASKQLGPAVPLFRRAGQWLNMLQTVPPAIANDEILLTVAKVSLILRGMYKTRFDEAQKAGAKEPTRRLVELQVAIQVLDALGTGLSGAAIPEAWDLVTAKDGDGERDGGGNDDGPKGAEGVDPGQAGLSSPESGVEVLDVGPVAAHAGDSDGNPVQPVLDTL